MGDGKKMISRPLVLLDIDGVINDLQARRHLQSFEPEHRAAEADRLGVDQIESHGYWVAIPRHMPELIRQLDERADIIWLTTWRTRANDEIAGYLGVGPFPVLDPDGRSLFFEWKIEAARPVIEEAELLGRNVIWIEDFDGDLPPFESVTYIDTGARGALQWSAIPERLLEVLAREDQGNRHSHGNLEPCETGRAATEGAIEHSSMRSSVISPNTRTMASFLARSSYPRPPGSISVTRIHRSSSPVTSTRK